MDGITVTPRQYTITMVCPLCHKPIEWKQAGVTTCPHCGAAFTIKPVELPDAYARGMPGPSEVKE